MLTVGSGSGLTGEFLYVGHSIEEHAALSTMAGWLPTLAGKMLC